MPDFSDMADSQVPDFHLSFQTQPKQSQKPCKCDSSITTPYKLRFSWAFTARQTWGCSLGLASLWATRKLTLNMIG